MDKRVNQKGVESENFSFRRFIKNRISKDDCRRSSGDSLIDSEEIVSDNRALLSLHPWIFKKESYREGLNIVDASIRGSISSRKLQRYSMKPVNFLGNYITPFTEHVEMEELVINSPPNSPAQTLRPLVVTDGNEIISKSSFDPFVMQPLNGVYKEDGGVSLGVKRASIGIPMLPELRKLKRKSSELQHERAEASNLEKPCKVLPFEGSPGGKLPFCVGISIGMISCILLKNTEVDNLSKLLKQSEDLVQDLQEELEMKDSLSVKELSYGTQQSQKHELWNARTEEPSTQRQNHNMDECDCTYLNLIREKSESQSLRQIEAELEVELERLEQNMNACSIEQRMSNLSELDPDLIADVVQGELSTANLRGVVVESQANSHSNTNTTSTGHTNNADYSVSPKELSLRLHHVIETRLQERIRDLERELVRTQRILSNSDLRLFSSDQESLREMQMGSALIHPLCLKLSGDALEAYDEAHEEFMQIAGKETLISSGDRSESIDGYRSNSPGRRSLPWKNISWSRDEGDDDGDDYSDEEGKMLIQQLVENQRRGSPAVTNARRMLLLMGECNTSAKSDLDI